MAYTEAALADRQAGRRPFALADILPATPRSWLLVAILLLAVAVRLWALGLASLAHDEVWRANFAHHGGLGEARRVPPLVHVLGYLLQHGMGRTELILRLPDALAGIAAVVAIFAFTRRYFGMAAALFATAFAGVHPELVLYSRCCKGVSFEVLMSIVVVWAGLEAWRRRDQMSAAIFVVAGLVGLSLTFTTSLLIAAWAPFLAYAYLQTPTRANVLTCLVAAVGLGAGGLLWYWWLAGCPYRDMLVAYHGATLGAWPTSYAVGDLARWAMGRGYGMLRYVLGLLPVYAPLKWMIGTGVLVGMAAGLPGLLRSTRVLGGLLVVLAGELLVVGALKLWPLGEHHTAIFLVPGVAVIVGIGLGEMHRALRWNPGVGLVLALSVGLPGLRAVKHSIIEPDLFEHTRPIFEYIDAHHAAGDALFVYYAVDDAAAFYYGDAPMPVLVQPRSDRQHEDLFVARFDAWAQQHARVWFIMTHPYGDERDRWIGRLMDEYDVQDRIEIADAIGLLFARRD